MTPDSIDMAAGLAVIAAVLVVMCVFAGIDALIEHWRDDDES